MTTTEHDLGRVVDAAGRLNIEPRGDRWTHLSLCVLDAVYSIGVKYAATTNVVHKYADLAGIPTPLAPADQVAAGAFAADEETVTDLADRIAKLGPDDFATAVGNRHRTSTRNGILKSEATLRYAEILAKHDVNKLADVQHLLRDTDRLGPVEADLARVPGHGSYGIRTDYLWMLAGDDQHVKADRMVLRWLTRVLHRDVTPADAKALLHGAAQTRGVTPWQLDHAIWKAASGRT